ncbi:SAM-dependent methyltransferase [Corynebacterium yudongzhengii]|uniref:Methyltransferase domain-containing protein n=1 Tax=Corynebacterium yudongzhengii TaxID=2080740 RepID=A0A2U1T9J3_9CORY|nr:methyltransferase domain-containing protein [Corynebacterium yudongzhengii]AWB82159.1 SAM-dependent methyltransferase [Corynebacterium yudongzhengii]PWC02663.1 methyltransferase domain-containing protein [Corynebacterium yudongzhengii]
MLSHVIDLLADPVDGTALSGVDDYARLTSASGHSYDVAKQGYVTLAGGAGLKHQGDSAEMVQARETFLSLGHFAPFVEAVSAAAADALDAAGVPEDHDPAILEVGAGTGYYLAHTLDVVQEARGVGLDISTAAARRLAKAHPRLGAVVADIWDGLPLLDDTIDVISVIFAPRNPAEFARVLRADGQVITLTPAPGHLDELREPLGIIGVEANKLERMIDQAEGHLRVLGEPESLEFTMTLDRSAIAAQVGMSPSARHIEDLSEKLERLPETMTVTARAHLTRLGRV